MIAHSVSGISFNVKQVSGFALARRGRSWPLPQRAELALELHNGDAGAWPLTKRQAAALAGVKIKHLAAIESLKPEERAAIRRGDVSFAEVLKNRRKPPSEAAIHEFIARAGAEAILAALDQLTRPQLAAAAE